MRTLTSTRTSPRMHTATSNASTHKQHKASQRRHPHCGIPYVHRGFVECESCLNDMWNPAGGCPLRRVEPCGWHPRALAGFIATCLGSSLVASFLDEQVLQRATRRVGVDSRGGALTTKRAMRACAPARNDEGLEILCSAAT